MTTIRQTLGRVRRAATGLQAVDDRLARIEGALGRTAKLKDVRAIGDRLDSIEEMLRKATAPAPGTSDQGAWATGAQSGELDFHVRNTIYRGDEEVWARSVEAGWQEVGLEKHDLAGKTIVDVGAGSRLRPLWFTDAEVIVIEPLADKFIAEVSWCDLQQAAEVYSVPGEEFVPQVEGRADFLTSVNALDHGYDLRASFENIRRYLKPDGRAVVSMDMHDQVSDTLHPMIVKHEMLLDLYVQVGLTVTKTAERARYHGGVGPGARHYWLTPSPVDAQAVEPAAGPA